uniref:Gastrin-releasing peptide n=1 Tax=Bombina orientalis TaxID=8346 RepID=GRP_BOMOR|nr:RecName: Full=Gastrin-releasing peptide; Short=GRP-29; Contains: RecName: Full=Neuromedin-C; AltName: Full=GRP-10; Contains: RecName: Full=C-terminal extension peptide; Short=CTEP; Flags: Precursor [Bombina orientalis]AAA51409.1 gastrin-releasing peptide [Bombina orientalis]
MEGVLLFWKYRALFFLVLCSLVLCKVHLSQASPTSQQHNDAASLSKIYPRGSHWAVGHLMGKKSIEEYPYAYDEADRSSAAVFSEGDKPSDGYQQWKESLLNLLKMIEVNEYRNSKAMREASVYNKKFSGAEDNNLKEMLDYLYQMMNMKENTSS